LVYFIFSGVYISLKFKEYNHFNNWLCQIGGKFMLIRNQFAELVEEADDAFWPLRLVDHLVQVAGHNDA
jgi:hypothetical protein